MADRLSCVCPASRLVLSNNTLYTVLKMLGIQEFACGINHNRATCACLIDRIAAKSIIEKGGDAKY